LKKILFLLITLIVFNSCKEDTPENIEEIKTIPEPKVVYEYGYKLNDYKVINDTIKKGESFGVILDRHHVDYPIINKIASKIKDTFDVRRVRAGKPYTILAAKDSTEKAQIFIYKNNKSVATIVEFNDSIIHSFKYRKEIKTIEKEVHGKIYSSLSQSMDSLHKTPNLTNKVADIYAWTSDFIKLKKGHTSKLIYEEKFIYDSTCLGYGEINAGRFTSSNKEFYAYRFVCDEKK